MHPTIDEQLSGVRRLIGVAETDSALSALSNEALANARRLLEQVQRSWAALLPFYRNDNDRLAGLISRAGHAPAASAEIGYDDVVAQAGRNAALRQELAAVIARLPDSPANANLLADVTEYLIARVDADPS